MRLSGDRCLDTERLEAAVVRITDKNIDAFHQVGQVSGILDGGDTLIIGSCGNLIGFNIQTLIKYYCKKY